MLDQREQMRRGALRYSMAIEIIHNIERWQELRADWDRLAKHNPMLCFDWMFAWWQVYGAGSRLCILVARNSTGKVVAIAPLYEHSPRATPSLRFIASGAVCSDYLTIMSEPHDHSLAVPELADCIKKMYGRFSSNTFSQGVFLEGLAVNAEMNQEFRQCMQQRGFRIHSRPLDSGWRVTLPDTWEQYVSRLGGYRRKARKALKVLSSGAVQAREIVDARYADQGLAMLKSLHLMRRSEHGDRGCFDDPRFEKFLQLAIPPMLESGKAKFAWIEAEGRPISILLSLLGDNWVAQYQSGMNPDAAHLEPGHISVAFGIYRAISEGHAEYDFLRGDEPYKQHWSAVPVPMEKVWLVPPTICARTSLAIREAAIHCRRLYSGSMPVAGELA